MMRKTFLVRLTTENDAMQDPAAVANVLRELAERVESGAKAGLIRDENGNMCGSFLWSLAQTPDDAAQTALEWGLKGK